MRIRQLLKNFAERAFRQPISQDIVEPYVQMVLKQKVQPLMTLPGGIKDLKYEVYKGLWEKLPDFDTLQPVARGTLPKGLMDIKVSKNERAIWHGFHWQIECTQGRRIRF